MGNFSVETQIKRSRKNKAGAILEKVDPDIVCGNVQIKRKEIL